VLCLLGRCTAKRPRPSRQSTATPRDAKCWFCLGSGKDPHLVLAVGEHFYVAAAKGGLVPEHVLIVPVNHVHSSLDAGVTERMAAEVAAWKAAVARWYREELGVGAYFFERAVFTRGGLSQMHMHIQCVPTGTGTGGRRAVEAVVEEWGMGGVQFLSDGASCVERLQQLCAEQCGGEAGAWKQFEFFWAELPDGTRAVQNVTGAVPRQGAVVSGALGATGGAAPATDGAAEAGERRDASGDEEAAAAAAAERGAKLPSRHPLHFGRKVATVLLDLPERVDWKSCVGALREEQRAAGRVRDAFAPFEPDLDGGDGGE
jgi:diadenosine tetraphosphate (Ap4A) HIT family hydrolase